MNNQFSIKRLWLLLKKQWFDNARLYILSLLALIGVMAMVFFCWGLLLNFSVDEEETAIIFVMFLFSVGPIVASQTFSALGDKAKGSYWLMVPATHLEKMVCGVIYSVILFALMYSSIFFVLQKISFFILLNNSDMEFRALRDGAKFYKQVATGFVAVQCFFIAGSVFFEKFSFIKTVLSALVVVICYVVLARIFGPILMPNHMYFETLTTVHLTENNETKILSLGKSVDSTIETMARYIWAPVLLLATYFRLVEKEI